MAVTVNMNAAAATLVGSNTKFRLEARDGALFVRPTDRKASKDLVAVTRKNTGATFSLGTKRLADLGVALEPGAKLALVTDKYGWLALVPATDGAEALVRVSKKS